MKIEQDMGTFNNNKKSKSKLTTIISVLIVITILIVIAIVVLMLSMNEKSLVVSVDGKNVQITEDTFLFEENSREVYISIKDIAPLVGYESHNGEYKINKEDTSKMYVEAKDGTETTSFFLNSALVSKVEPDSKKDYENIKISAPVIAVDGKFYINAEGFMQSFNSVFSYNKVQNTITIQTLPYLVSYYKTNAKSYGYDALSEDFENQKALIYGMMIASKGTTGLYGVVDTTTGEEIIGPRYNKIKFVESSKEFIITNADNKVGIAFSTGETKINVAYDDIKMIDSTLGYYLVESNSKYGIVDSSEKLIIHIEYDKIGIEPSEFPADEIKNQYILYDKIIPVCVNKKWTIFDTTGKKMSEEEFDDIGSINTHITDRVVNNSVMIGESGVVVVSKDGKYGGISTRGDMLIPVDFEYICSVTSGGETTYYIVMNGKNYKALDYINAMKKALGYPEDEIKEEKKPVGETGNNSQNTNTNTVGNTVTNTTTNTMTNDVTNSTDMNIVDINATNTANV